MTPTGLPATARKTAVLPSRDRWSCWTGRGARRYALAGQKGQVAQEHLLALDPGLHPQARDGLKVLHRGRLRFLRRAAWVTASARGCSDLSSRAAAQVRTCPALQPLPGVEVRHLGAAPGEGAGLVEDHGGQAVGPLQGFAAPHQDAHLRPPARAHHDRGGGGQAHGAGAGDDEHRHHADEGPGEGRRRPPKDQARKVRAASTMTTGTKMPATRSTRRSMGALLVWASSTSRMIWESTMSCAHPGGLEDQKAALVQGGAPDLGPRLLGHRQALAGEHGFIHAGGALHHHAVHGDLLPGPHHHQVAHRHLLQGHFLLPGRPGAPGRWAGPGRRGGGWPPRPGPGCGPPASGPGG